MFRGFRFVISHFVRAARSVHPNYAQHHEGNHKPRMHGGMVLKASLMNALKRRRKLRKIVFLCSFLSHFACMQVNANQRYATTTATSLLIEELARERRIPLQSFVVKNDSPCGSTIGPIVASRVGLRTVDMGESLPRIDCMTVLCFGWLADDACFCACVCVSGLPMLSMHSIREMSSASDVDHGLNLLENFFNRFTGECNALRLRVRLANERCDVMRAELDKRMHID